MARQIWKFTLPVQDRVVVEMPKNARALSVAEQGDNLCLWAIVDPDEDRVKRVFYIVGTGRPYDFDKMYRFIGTVVCAGGALVWHVWEAMKDD